MTPLHGDEDFWRRPQDGQGRQLEEIHVGRRIQRPQQPVDVERFGLYWHREALRELHLVDVSRQDVRLRLLDRLEKIGLRHVALRADRGRPVGRFQCAEANRTVQAAGQIIDPCHGLGVPGFDRGSLGANVRHEFQLVAHMVETGERVGDDEDAVCHAQWIRRRNREALEVARRFVAEVSDGAAAEAFG